MSQDIRDALEGWEFEPGAITVRKILGEDGLPRVQMRLELGIIQMEVYGRPDGQRPQGYESYLDYFRQEIKDQTRRQGSSSSFRLSASDCAKLRAESLHYYYRYLSLFHLNEFAQVEKDTAHNLEVADILKKYGPTEEDRRSIEQYRAYILMMNTQARARLAWAEGNNSEALGAIRRGIRLIHRFLQENLEDPDDSHEIRLIEELESEIILDLPDESREKLEMELKEAIILENFEKAASLRDRLRCLEETE